MLLNAVSKVGAWKKKANLKKQAKLLLQAGPKRQTTLKNLFQLIGLSA